MTKIINLYGSPSTGKSTLASGLFYKMKIAGFNVELADEWIKSKVFEEAPYPFTDQLYTFAKQNKRLNQLKGKADYVICDSPLLQICVYKSHEPEIFDEMALAYYNRYDNINIFLHRDHEFRQEGRVHNEEQSKEIEIQIEQMLDKYNIPYMNMQTTGALDTLYNMIYLADKNEKDNKPIIHSTQEAREGVLI